MSVSSFSRICSLILNAVPYRVRALFRRDEPTTPPRVLVTYGRDDRIIFIRTSEGRKEIDPEKSQD